MGNHSGGEIVHTNMCWVHLDNALPRHSGTLEGNSFLPPSLLTVLENFSTPLLIVVLHVKQIDISHVRTQGIQIEHISVWTCLIMEACVTVISACDTCVAVASMNNGEKKVTAKAKESMSSLVHIEAKCDISKCRHLGDILANHRKRRASWYALACTTFFPCCWSLPHCSTFVMHVWDDEHSKECFLMTREGDCIR